MKKKKSKAEENIAWEREERKEKNTFVFETKTKNNPTAFDILTSWPLVNPDNTKWSERKNG